MLHTGLFHRFNRWVQQRRFANQLRLVRDGISLAEVVALLGAPDGELHGDTEAGIDTVWAYFERLPDHRIVQFGIASGCVAYSSITTIPDDAFRAEFRALFISRVQPDIDPNA